MEPGTTLEHRLEPGYGAYFYTIWGKVRLNGNEMSGGDAAKGWDEERLVVEGVDQSEVYMVVARV